MHKRSRCVKFIAFWMILSTFPGMLYLGLEKNLLPVMMFEMLCYFGFLVCAVGLFFKKEWARRGTISFLYLFFFLILYVIFALVGPYFTISIEWFCDRYEIPKELGKRISLILLTLYIIWPIIVIYVLTHPKVKQIFDPHYNPEEDDPLR